MLQLQKEKQQTNLPDKLKSIKARIKYTDDKINQLVFELYGLGEEERGNVPVSRKSNEQCNKHQLLILNLAMPDAK
jgi:hypothetical protein